MALATLLILVSVSLAYESDRNRFINSFCITFPCNLNYGFPFSKQYSRLFCGGMNWHNLNNCCIFSLNQQLHLRSSIIYIYSKLLEQCTLYFSYIYFGLEEKKMVQFLDRKSVV